MVTVVTPSNPRRIIGPTSHHHAPRRAASRETIGPATSNVPRETRRVRNRAAEGAKAGRDDWHRRIVDAHIDTAPRSRWRSLITRAARPAPPGVDSVVLAVRPTRPQIDGDLVCTGERHPGSTRRTGSASRRRTTRDKKSTCSRRSSSEIVALEFPVASRTMQPPPAPRPRRTHDISPTPHERAVISATKCRACAPTSRWTASEKPRRGIPPTSAEQSALAQTHPIPKYRLRRPRRGRRRSCGLVIRFRRCPTLGSSPPNGVNPDPLDTSGSLGPPTSSSRATVPRPTADLASTSLVIINASHDGLVPRHIDAQARLLVTRRRCAATRARPHRIEVRPPGPRGTEFRPATLISNVVRRSSPDVPANRSLVYPVP